MRSTSKNVPNSLKREINTHFFSGKNDVLTFFHTFVFNWNEKIEIVNIPQSILIILAPGVQCYTWRIWYCDNVITTSVIRKGLKRETSVKRRFSITIDPSLTSLVPHMNLLQILTSTLSDLCNRHRMREGINARNNGRTDKVIHSVRSNFFYPLPFMWSACSWPFSYLLIYISLQI